MQDFSVEEIEQILHTSKPELVEEAQRFRADLEPIAAGIRPRIRSLSRIRAVLFDVYGTLLISAAGEVGTAQESTELQKQQITSYGEDGREAASSDSAERFLSVLEKTGFAIRSDRKYAEEKTEKLYYGGIELEHKRLNRQGVTNPEVNIVEIWDRILNSLLEEGDIAAAGRKSVGKNAEKSLDRHSESKKETALLEAVRVAFFFEITANVVSPMPGVLQCIRELTARKMPVGIVSNAQFYTPLVMEAVFGQAPKDLGFDEDISVWSWKLREAKPSPRLFAPALENLERKHGIAPHEVLYIGNDMRNDILPSKELGCAAALFAGDKRSLRLREEDTTASTIKPDVVLTDLLQLSRVVVESPV